MINFGGRVWWNSWSWTGRKEKENNKTFPPCKFPLTTNYVLASLSLRKLSLKRKAPWKFKVSKLLSLKEAISHLMLEITAYDFQPFSEIRCEFGHYWLDIIFSNMSDIFGGFSSWVLPSFPFSWSFYMPPFHVSDVSKWLYSDCSPLYFDSVGYFPPSGFRLLNGYLEANISTF